MIQGSETGSIFGLSERSDTAIEKRDATAAALPAAITTWFEDHSGALNASGEAINYRTALTIPTVFAAVRTISESVASLPLLLYELIGNGHEEATDHPLYYLLTVEPNPTMTAFSLIEAIIASLCLAGNAYVEIERNPAGQCIGLWPLHPRHTEAKYYKGRLVYKTTDGVDSDQPGAYRLILPEDMLHMPLFSFDGLRGFDPITLMRQSLGVAKAAERQAALWYANNSMPTGGVLIGEEEMEPEQEKEFAEAWERTQGGMQKGRIGVLTGKWKIEAIGLNAEQIQFLQTRQYQRTDIAAMYRLSPSQLGDTTRQANSNKVQENLSFVTDCLRPYLTRIEAEITRKLLPNIGRKAGLYRVRFDISERLRGDFLTTQQGYALGRQWGYLSANDVRRAEGLNIGGPELDVYWYPVNMGNAKALLNDDVQVQQQQAFKNSIRHLIPQWRAAFDTYSASDERSFDLFVGAFRPVLRALFDQLDFDNSSLKPDENDMDERLAPVLRSLFRRSASWPPAMDPEHIDVMGAELTKTSQHISRSLPAKTTRQLTDGN